MERYLHSSPLIKPLPLCLCPISQAKRFFLQTVTNSCHLWLKKCNNNNSENVFYATVRAANATDYVAPLSQSLSLLSLSLSYSRHLKTKLQCRKKRYKHLARKERTKQEEKKSEIVKNERQKMFTHTCTGRLSQS